MFLRKVISTNVDKILIKQGDLIYADFGKPIGSEQGGVRPCIVLQNDVGNKFGRTFIVAAMTSEIKNEGQPTHFVVENYKEVGLPERSMILFEQIRVIDKDRIRYYRPFGHIDLDSVLEPLLRTFGFTMSEELQKKVI